MSRRATTVLRATAAVAVTGTMLGCGGERDRASERASVVPLSGESAGSGAGAAEQTGATDTTPAAAPIPSPTDPATTSDADSLTAEVDDLLARYDAALGALSGEPLAATDAAHPLSVAWHDVTAAGSALDEELRKRIVADGRDNSTRLRPGTEGVTYRTLALEVRPGTDGSATFTHCGYSPGIGVHTVTGEVLDDRRASTRGEGRAVRRADGRLVVVELRDDELTLLAPDEPDPCPTLQAAARAASTGSEG